jgi:toxin secretion/phage lysis holin
MEHVYRITMTVLGGIVGYLWGGWSALLGILLAFVIIDYITGFIAAGAEGKLSSSVGFRGIAKKIIIFVLVAVGHLLDKALGGQNDMFRDATIFFFLANELLSIIENAGRAGVPIPQILQNAVEILKGKGDEKNG